MGYGILMGDKARQQAHVPPVVGALPPQPIFGVTSPATILNRLTEVDTAVQTTNAAINLKPPVGPQGADFLDRWKDWYDRWNQFVANQRSLANLLSPAAWLAQSDETAREIEARARQHDQLRNEYVHLGGQVIGPDVPPIPPPKSSWSVPWWVWTLGGVAIVGIGYYAYRTYIGKPLEIARGLKGRDQASGFRPQARGGENDRPVIYVREGSPEPPASYPTGIPLSVEDVAVHPMPAQQRIVYRPYQHPHVVAGAHDRTAPAPHGPPVVFRSLDGYKEPDVGGGSFEHDFEDDEEW